MNLVLKRTSIESISLEIPFSHDFVAVFLSDLHLGQYLSFNSSIDSILEAFEHLINEKHPQMIFILGDIIHKRWWRFFSSDWFTFFEKLEKFQIPFHIIPGNHDRYLQSYISSYKGIFVHFYPLELIILKPNNQSREIALGHDLRNDLKVHGSDLIFEWIDLLRSNFSNEIKNNSLLILGHLHEIQTDPSGLSKTLGPFSADLRSFSYGLLQANQKNEFDVTLQRIRYQSLFPQ